MSTTLFLKGGGVLESLSTTFKAAAFFALEPLFAFDLVEDLRVLGDEEVMIKTIQGKGKFVLRVMRSLQQHQ